MGTPYWFQYVLVAPWVVCVVLLYIVISAYLIFRYERNSKRSNARYMQWKELVIGIQPLKFTFVPAVDEQIRKLIDENINLKQENDKLKKQNLMFVVYLILMRLFSGDWWKKVSKPKAGEKSLTDQVEDLKKQYKPDNAA